MEVLGSLEPFEATPQCSLWRETILNHTVEGATGTSLAVQWVRLRASTAVGMGSIPGGGTKIPHAVRHGQKKKTNHGQSKIKKKNRKKEQGPLVNCVTFESLGWVVSSVARGRPVLALSRIWSSQSSRETPREFCLSFWLALIYLNWVGSFSVLSFSLSSSKMTQRGLKHELEERMKAWPPAHIGPSSSSSSRVAITAMARILF